MRASKRVKGWLQWEEAHRKTVAMSNVTWGPLCSGKAAAVQHWWESCRANLLFKNGDNFKPTFLA